MNAVLKIFLGLLAAAPATTPVFIHSPQGLLVANASEEVLASILAQFAKPPAA